MTSALDWVQTSDPSGQTMWVNQKTFKTTYSNPLTEGNLMLEILELSNRVSLLEKKQVWIRVRADKTVIKGNGLKILKVDTTCAVFSFAFEHPRDNDNYGVVSHAHHQKFYRTWGRVTNMTCVGFDVHLLTESGTAITGYPDIEITCFVCG